MHVPRSITHAALLALLSVAPVARAQPEGAPPTAEESGGAGDLSPDASSPDDTGEPGETSEASPPPVSGGTDEDTRRELSRRRFVEGVRAYEAGRYKDAIDLLLEADRAMHHAAFAFNIGLAYQAMGDYTSALRWLRTYLRELPNAEDRGEVEKTISNLEGRLEQRGVQQVTVLSQPDGAMVLVDKRAVGVTPWTGELPPGRHVVTLQLRGYDDVEQSFMLEAHRARDVVMTLQPGSSRVSGGSAATAAVSETDVPEPDRGGGGGVSPWTWITLGAGAGVLGGGLAFEILRAQAETDASKASQVDYQDALDKAKSRQLTARVLAGVGGALALTGGVLLVIDLTSGSEPVQAGLGCGAVGCRATAGGTW